MLKIPSSSCKRFLDTDNMQFVSFATELIAKSSLAKEFVYFFIGRIGMTMIADAAQEEVFS